MRSPAKYVDFKTGSYLSSQIVVATITVHFYNEEESEKYYRGGNTMKIKEVIELTKQQPLAEVAKQYLSIGEKPARKAMHRAGCYTIVGQPGWIFDDSENPINLERSIYEFAEEAKEIQKQELRHAANLETNQETEFIPRKRHSFDLDVRLVKELKLYCVKEDKTLYEVVEEAIREYLQRNDKAL